VNVIGVLSLSFCTSASGSATGVASLLLVTVKGPTVTGVVPSVMVTMIWSPCFCSI